MKTSFSLCNCYLACVQTLMCGLLAVLVLMHPQSTAAQFVPAYANTNSYNVFAYDTLSGNSFSADPDPYGKFGGDALTYFVFPFNLLPNGAYTPIGPVNITPFSLSGSSATFSSSFEFDAFPVPTTTTPATVVLNNPNSSPDEIRLDWMGVYLNNSGSPITIPVNYQVNTTATMTSPSSYAQVAAGMRILIDGSNYVATLNGTPYANGAGPGPWANAGSGVTTANNSFPLTFLAFSPIVVTNGDIAYAQGYVDLIVDPGIVRVQLIAAPPALGIANYFGNPVVFYPAIAGAGFNLQMTTNLLTGPWANVTNGLPFTAVLVTNSSAAGFFRLH
jgi:hypothetical protein